jgi:hypothetical protein
MEFYSSKDGRQVFLSRGHAWLPYSVGPSRPVVTTLPAHTVSRHLVEKGSKKPGNQAIVQLLQSLVRSTTPDLVTKTMLTTFTSLTTLLKASNTIVKSRSEVQIIDNWVNCKISHYPSNLIYNPSFLIHNFFCTLRNIQRAHVKVPSLRGIHSKPEV